MVGKTDIRKRNPVSDQRNDRGSANWFRTVKDYREEVRRNEINASQKTVWVRRRLRRRGRKLRSILVEGRHTRVPLPRNQKETNGAPSFPCRTYSSDYVPPSSVPTPIDIPARQSIHASVYSPVRPFIHSSTRYPHAFRKMFKVERGSPYASKPTQSATSSSNTAEVALILRYRE